MLVKGKTCRDYYLLRSREQLICKDYQVGLKVESYSSRYATELRYYLKGKTMNNKMNSCLKIRRWKCGIQKGTVATKKKK